jgi:hypothetical protein
VKGSLSKAGIVRITIITILGLCAVGAVMLGLRVHQALFQESSEDDYD